MSHWTEAINWKQSWIEEGAIEPGAQAAAKKVLHKVDGRRAFMKILNGQSDHERRSRFFREATAYATLQHPNIPRIVESNAHRHDDLTVKLYLATELIAGTTLTKLIERQRATLEQAIALTQRLLDVADHFHRHDWVHRDIKPDNIIVRGDDLADPVLVDFGVSYKDDVTPGFQTELAQELGNRFFRLPELGIQSPIKHDSRTDLTFVAGVMFYSLTGLAPYQPLDGDYKMPHQRATELALLRDAAPIAIYPLLSFFDRAFDHRLTNRFETASEMSKQLEALLAASKNGVTVSEPSDLDSLRQRVNSAASAKFGELKIAYTLGMHVLYSVHTRVLESVAPTYESNIQYYTDFSQGMQADVGFHYFASINHRFGPHFTVVLVGDEIVMRVENEVIYRTPADNPDFEDPKLREMLTQIFVAGLNDLIATEPRPGN